MLLVDASVIYCNEGGHFMDLHGVHHWILSGHFQLFTNLNLDEYREITVTFEGNLERGTFDDPDFDQKKEFAFVYRYGPGCCFNDVLAGMYLDYDGYIPKDNSWVRVSGKPYYFDHNGFSELFLKVDKLTVLSKRGKIKVKD